MQYSLLERIAGKLMNSGINKSNYTKEKAIEILSLCAGKTAVLKCLEEQEEKIKSILK